MNIKDSVVLVTGSNRGLGRTLVEELLARCAKRVYAASRAGKRDFEDPRVVPLALDLTDPASIASAALSAADVQLLVNNAGVYSAGPVLAATREQRRGDVEVNDYGLLEIVRAFRPTLQRTKGSIANVLSLVSLANGSMFGGYAATKAAAWSLTQALRVDGIRVHASFPGLIDTGMVKGCDGGKATPLQIAKARSTASRQACSTSRPTRPRPARWRPICRTNDLIRAFAGSLPWAWVGRTIASASRARWPASSRSTPLRAARRART